MPTHSWANWHWPRATSRSPADTSASRCNSASRRFQRAKVTGPLAYSQPANRAFYGAGRGLVTSLVKLGMTQKAVDLVEDLVRLDPHDPLKLRALLDEARSGGLPIVELTPAPPKNDNAS